LDNPDRIYTNPVDYFSLKDVSQLQLIADILGRNIPVRMTAWGSSMQPFIRDGDVITINPLGTKNPEPGDVVAFVIPQVSKLIVHRIVKKETGSFLMRGDNNSQFDGWIENADILGVITTIQRGKRIWNCGSGWKKKVIAWLSRHNVLSLSKGLFELPVRVAAWGVELIQSTRLFRKLRRMFLKEFVILEADRQLLRRARKLFGEITIASNEMTLPMTINFIAMSGDRIYGYARLLWENKIEPESSVLMIDPVIVRMRYRRMGVGGALLSEILKKALAMGANEISVKTEKAGKAAISLITKNGFIRKDEKSWIYTKSDNVL